jgi:hypothetical protein
MARDVLDTSTWSNEIMSASIAGQHSVEMANGMLPTIASTMSNDPLMVLQRTSMSEMKNKTISSARVIEENALLAGPVIFVRCLSS